MTFKELDTRGKIEHIWEYYRLRIFMIGFCIIAGISLIYTIFIKPHPQTYCGLAMYDQFISMADIETMTDELNTMFSLNTDEYTVDVQSFYSDGTDVMVEAQLNEKFNTYIFASQFNLLFGTEEDTNTFIESTYVAPLSDYLSAEEIAQYDAKGLVLYATDPYSSKVMPMALNIKDSKMLKKYGLYEGRECYISFVPMPEETKENTINVFRKFVE